MTLFERVIEHFGGTHQSLADVLRIERSAVTLWRGVIPKSRAFEIQVLSEGKFTAAEIEAEYLKNFPERAHAS